MQKQQIFSAHIWEFFFFLMLSTLLPYALRGSESSAPKRKICSNQKHTQETFKNSNVVFPLFFFDFWWSASSKHIKKVLLIKIMEVCCNCYKMFEQLKCTMRLICTTSVYVPDITSKWQKRFE